jgi:hypothetical protein
VMGGGLPPRGGYPTPVAKSRIGVRGAGARGGCGSTHHRAVRGRSGVRRESAGACLGGVWGCCGGGDMRHNNVRRTLEEEEA